MLAAGAVVVVAAVGAVLLSQTSPAPRHVAARYGGIPSWLPRPKVHVGRTVQASAAHPWLAIEGDTVAVHLARGRVLATAVGPAVPAEGQFPVPATTPCTLTLTFTSASGAVPLSSAAFTIVDESGHVHRLRLAGAGAARVPTRVTAGRTVTLTLSAVLPTGNGRLSWAPDGGRPIVSWDFEVEID